MIAISAALEAVRSLACTSRAYRWRLASTAPCNQPLELRVAEGGHVETLDFPCLKTNEGKWINSDLGSAVSVNPIEWRVWGKALSPEPHRRQKEFRRVNVRRAAVAV